MAKSSLLKMPTRALEQQQQMRVWWEQGCSRVSGVRKTRVQGPSCKMIKGLVEHNGY